MNSLLPEKFNQNLKNNLNPMKDNGRYCMHDEFNAGSDNRHCMHYECNADSDIDSHVWKYTLSTIHWLHSTCSKKWSMSIVDSQFRTYLRFYATHVQSFCIISGNDRHSWWTLIICQISNQQSVVSSSFRPCPIVSWWIGEYLVSA